MIESNYIEKKSYIYEFYYLIILCVILLQLFMLPGIRLGVVSSFLIFLVVYNNVNKHDLLKNNIINKLVLGYLIYNTLSVIFYIFLDIPLSVYFAEWSNSILPIFFFYFSNKGEPSNSRFYYVTLSVLIFSFLLGYFLWINDSEEYKYFMITTEGYGTGIDFFQSLYGLTATGAFGVIGFLISANLVIKSRGKQGKIVMIICILATIFTFRRGSIVSLFVAFIILHFVAYFKYNFIKFRFFFLEVSFLIVAFKYWLSDFDFFFENLIERSSMISEAVGERSFTWSVAFQDWNFVFGRGLGTLGHKAIGFSKVLIADGNYFKMIGEIGIIGSFIFLMILIFSFWRGILNFKNTFLDLGIVFCICLIAVGSNIFTYQSIAPIFWFSIGRLSNFKNSLS
jgi:hypothetical protein